MWFKANKEQIKLKSSYLLSVKEYFELMSDRAGLTVLSYINVTCNKNYTDINDFSNKGNKLALINQYIADIRTFEYFMKKGKAQEKFVFRNDLINLKKVDWNTFGLVEQYSIFSDGTKTNIEASLFVLAVIVNVEINKDNKAKRFDKDSIMGVYNELFELNYLDVLPSAVFFFKKLMNGLSKKIKYSRKRVGM